MTHHHDIVVIGASAGGLEPLKQLLAELPPTLQAAILIVMHLSSSSLLAQVLGRRAVLPVEQAASGTPIKRGRVYVAAPGRHLLVHDGHLLVRRGPRENLARPAIDPLFRSAAASFGARVIGIILSGALNDGTAGLLAVKRCGGLAIVQDPQEAAVPDMPKHALRRVDVDHCVPMDRMPALLTRLVAEPAGESPEIPLGVRLEAAIAAQELTGMESEDLLGRGSPFSCPECHGALWEIDDGELLRYRCHVGHAFTGEAMLAAQAREVERTLSILLRSHQERAELARRMAAKENAEQRLELAAQFEARAQEYRESADLIEQLLAKHFSASAPDNVEESASSD